MVPVRIEHVGHILHDRADPHHVQVAEFRVFANPEVFVGYVAPADNRDLVVDREGLVVHAAVYSPEAGQGALDPASSTAMERVEYPNLEIGV